MLKVLLIAGATVAAASPALAESAWRDAPAPRHVRHVSRDAVPRQVEGPLVNGSVVPARISRAPVGSYRPEGDRPVALARPQPVGYVRPYGDGYGDQLGYDGYAGEGRTVNRTTTSVVLGNGSIVTNERVSTGGPVPSNTYGIDGLVPATPLMSSGYYDRGYGYAGYGGYDRYGRHGYRNHGGLTILPSYGTIVNLD